MRLSLSHAVTALALITTSSAQDARDPSPISGLLPDVEELKLETWTTQLHLDREPLQKQIQWVYLSGRETCNGTVNVCESFDDAVAKGYHVLSAQGDRPNLSYIDCDSDPIFCYSWLMKPPAIMHFTVDPEAEIPILLRPIRLSPSNKTDDDQYARITPTEARKRLTPIINGARPVTQFHVWDGLMNPFTGKLGTLGLNVRYGWIVHNVGWFPFSWQTFCMIMLAFCRFMIWVLSPSRAGQPTIDELVLNPGAMDLPTDSTLGEAEGDALPGSEKVSKEEKKEQ